MRREGGEVIRRTNEARSEGKMKGGKENSNLTEEKKEQEITGWEVASTKGEN